MVRAAMRSAVSAAMALTVLMASLKRPAPRSRLAQWRAQAERLMSAFSWAWQHEVYRLQAIRSSYLSNSTMNKALRASERSSVTALQLLELFAAEDLDAIIDAAFHVLAATVPCDFVSAFFRSTGDGLLKQRDSLGRESGLEFMHRYMALTPALPVALVNPGIKVLTTRRHLPRADRELYRTPFYREIMQKEGWRHGVALCFWGEPRADSPVFVATVYRGEGQSDFSETEVANLESTHPLIDCALNRLREREAATTVRDAMAMTVREGTRGFAIRDANLRLVQANPVALRLCAAWVGQGNVMPAADPSGAWRLPLALEEVCHELHQDWQSVLRADPDTAGFRRHSGVLRCQVPGLSASIAIACPNTAGLTEPTFVLEFDRCVHGVPLETADVAAPVL